MIALIGKERVISQPVFQGQPREGTKVPGMRATKKAVFPYRAFPQAAGQSPADLFYGEKLKCLASKSEVIPT